MSGATLSYTLVVKQNNNCQIELTNLTNDQINLLQMTSQSLYDSQIGDEGAQALSIALQSPNCKLTTLL